MKVLGIHIDAICASEAVAQMECWIRSGESGRFVTLTNVHMLTEARRCADFRQVLSAASLRLADGMPLVWICRLRGVPAARLPGPDLLIEFCERTRGTTYRHYFYGGAPGVAQEMAEILQRRFPDVQVVGTCSPPFRALSPEEDARLVAQINDAVPDVLWVGLGCPKQERWMFAHRQQVRAPVMLGVGQAFDILAGRLARAPKWMQRSGCEWLFRLVREPRRLWRRYLLSNSEFVVCLLLESAGLKKFD